MMAMKTAKVLLLTVACTMLATAAGADRVPWSSGPGPNGNVAGPNDTCDGASPLMGAFDMFTDTCDDANDYELLAGNACTGYSSAGLDETYEVCLPAGASIDLEFEELDHDGSIYLVSDCADVVGSCVAGDDCFPDPCSDFISYTNLGVTPVTLYLIVDGFGAGTCGMGHLFGSAPMCNITAVGEKTWGEIKAIYN